MSDRPAAAERSYQRKATNGSYFAALESSKHLLLTTFTPDSLPASATVHGLVGPDRVCFRAWTWSRTAKNLRHTEEVQVAPCTALGLVRLGFPRDAVARLLTGEEASQAARKLARKHPVRQRALLPVLRLIPGWQLVYYELVSYEAAARPSRPDSRRLAASSPTGRAC